MDDTAYFDWAATAPMRPEAVEAMLPYLTSAFGNPSGSHHVARRAAKALDESRDIVAEALGVRPGEIVFTGGGTEADNLAISGVLGAAGGRVVCSAIEHHAVLDVVHHHGGTIVGVDAVGLIDLERLAEALTPEVRLVSVMAANNEVGTIQPLRRITRVVAKRAPQALVHTDAVQAMAWTDVASDAKHARLDLDQRTQVRRAEGGGRSGRSSRHPVARTTARWRSGAKPTQRHPERRGDRRDGRGASHHRCVARRDRSAGWAPCAIVSWTRCSPKCRA